MLTPWVLMSLVPLMWGEVGWELVIPLLGIVTLIGAVVNLAQWSVQSPLATSDPARS